MLASALKNHPLVRALPLCTLFFAMAAEDDCTIRILQGDDDEQCVDRDEVCPNLDCVEYATNEEGCELCECAIATCDDVDLPPPECANAIFDASIAPCGGWVCGGGSECSADADCGPGAVCELIEVCPGCVNTDPACLVPCTVEGRCVEVNTCNPDDNQPVCAMPPPACEGNLIPEIGQGCWTGRCIDPRTCEPPVEPTLCQDDSECGEGNFCNLDVCANPNCGSGGDDNDDPGFAPCEPVCSHGVCEPLRLSCDNVLCDVGTVCIETPAGPTCVGGEAECISDADCGQGERCNAAEVCLAPPGCGANGGDCPDVCAGFCVDENISECEALCGPNGQCVVFPDGSVGCEVPVGDCYADSDCGPGGTCNLQDNCLPPPECTEPNGAACLIACAGVCEYDTPPSECLADADCDNNQRCSLDCAPCNAPDGAACDASCQLVGTCVDVDEPPPPERCQVDSDCGPNQQCVEDCAPCNAPAGEPCNAICEIIHVCR